MTMEESVYRLLTLNRNAALEVYDYLKTVKGFNCTVRIPHDDSLPFRQYEEGTNRSIFGLEDLTDYDEDKTYTATLLIFNMFEEGSAGYDEFDTFTPNTFCLTTLEERLPLQAQIEINIYGRRMYFKVDDHKTLSPDIVEQLFVKNMLVPAT